MTKEEYQKLVNIYSTSKNKRKLKAALVAYKGGFCVRCGYADCQQALCFHHRDPAEKEFSIGEGNKIWRLEQAIKEIEKCDLLCLNCHAEVHDEISKQERLERSKKLSAFKRENNLCKAKRKTEYIRNNIPYIQDSKCPPEEDLRDLIEKLPSTRIAEIFDVSPSAVGKWCKKYGIKKPERGYWSRKRVNK
jgi:hypothetical protein